MANIKVSNLSLKGFDLFTDSENFLAELSESELCDIKGGIITSSPLGLPLSIVVIVNALEAISQNSNQK